MALSDDGSAEDSAEESFVLSSELSETDGLSEDEESLFFFPQAPIKDIVRTKLRPRASIFLFIISSFLCHRAAYYALKIFIVSSAGREFPS